MSLTKEALEARFSGGLVRLRELLNGAQVPDHVYGPSSVSDNVFQQVERRLKLSILILEHKNLVAERAVEIIVSDGSNPDAAQRDLEQMHSELHHGLAGGLRYFSELFEKRAR